jgi:hypothetical protein
MLIASEMKLVRLTTPYVANRTMFADGLGSKWGP